MKKQSLKFCRPLIALILIAQLIACGTLLYPERRGQGKGAIDPGVAILDGVGVLFFVVPGLIAFIVDISTGAIYLPSGKTTEQRLEELKGSGNFRIQHENGNVAVLVGPDRLTLDLIDTVVRTATGLERSVTDPELETFPLDGPVCLSAQYQVADNSLAAYSQLD
jgi:hypothetical protein